MKKERKITLGKGRWICFKGFPNKYQVCILFSSQGNEKQYILLKSAQRRVIRVQ